MNIIGLFHTDAMYKKMTHISYIFKKNLPIAKHFISHDIQNNLKYLIPLKIDELYLKYIPFLNTISLLYYCKKMKMTI